MDGETDELTELRAEIDRIDDDIASLISDRIHTAEKVAQVKARTGKKLVDENREAVVKSGYEDRFQREGLDSEHGRVLAEFLIEISLEREEMYSDS